MCYNMGQEKLEKFSTMNNAIKDSKKDWTLKAKEVEGSELCKKDKKRCDKSVTLIRTCINN